MNEVIKKIIKETLKTIKYETIILFGSRARKSFNEHSDYDILIILSQSLLMKQKISLSTELRKKLAENGIDADVIIKSKDEADYYKNRIGSVVKSALEEGVPL